MARSALCDAITVAVTSCALGAATHLHDAQPAPAAIMADVAQQATLRPLLVSLPVASLDGNFYGRYPNGNAPVGVLPLQLVYPQPDTITPAWARHRNAYWDGVHPFQHRTPIGVAFGSFPYTFALQSGPSGMAFGATTWAPGWTGADADAADYGVLLWTPTGPVTNAPVTVLVTDSVGKTITLSFTVSTTNSTTYFVFVDSVRGSDSSGDGSIGNPYRTLTGAFGAASTETKNQGATCVMRAGSYTLLPSTDLTTPVFRWDTTLKPAALIPFPGETVDIDTSQAMFGSLYNGSDSFIGKITCNGFDNTTPDYRLFFFYGSGTANQRITFDGTTWTNGGYGTPGAVVGLLVTTQPSGTLTPGTYPNIALTLDSSPGGSGCIATAVVNSSGVLSSVTPTSYGSGYTRYATLFVPAASIPGATSDAVVEINTTSGVENDAFVATSQNGGSPKGNFYLRGLKETGRQSGFPGNNMAICDFYTITGVLVECCSSVNTAANVDAAILMKSDIAYACVRANFISYASVLDCFGPAQQVVSGDTCGYHEYSFNIILGGTIKAPQNTSGPFGPIWVHHNNVANGANPALQSISPDKWGPYYFFNNLAETTVSPTPTVGTSVVSNNNFVAPSGLLDPVTGKVTSAYAYLTAQGIGAEAA